MEIFVIRFIFLVYFLRVFYITYFFHACCCWDTAICPLQDHKHIHPFLPLSTFMVHINIRSCFRLVSPPRQLLSLWSNESSATATHVGAPLSFLLKG